MDEALEAALKRACSQSPEQRGETFTVLKRAPPEQLGLWPQKAELLVFLSSFFQEKRIYRRQVLSFLELLLHDAGYREAAESLRSSWPEEMSKAMPDVEKEPCGGYGAEAPMAPERSMVDTLAMLDEALKRLAAAKYSFTMITGTGLEEDDLVQAFEVFRRAVCRMVQDERIETKRLDDVEPKESILSFLLAVIDKKPRQKKRIESLIQLLLERDSWRRVAEGDGLLAATARFREPPEVEEAAEEAVCEEVDVSALIEDGERRGVSGLLLVRVVAAHDLVNADWWSLSDPYAKVTVDQVTRSTQVVDDCLDPCWEEDLWCFDVAADSSLVRLEVWDKDAMQDDLLGLVSIPVAMVPTELKRLRFKLDQVEHGELEVEIRFLRLEVVQLLRSGRKLPGPAA